VTIRGVQIQWGAFITELVNFLIIAFSVFIIVKAFEAAKNLRHSADDDKEIKLTEVELLEEIRDILAAQQRREARTGGADVERPSTRESAVRE
jgi:large conductance mechanosensitive channel